MIPAGRATRRLLRWWPVAAVLLVAVLLLGLGRAGVHWFVVQTPSMGTTAPVGTLVVTTAARTADLHSRDVVTYRAPGGTATVTHRVVSVTPTGFRTRGDVNAAGDPWLLGDDRLVGRAVALLPGFGWLVRALPVLLGGVAVVLLATGRIRAVDLRRGLRVLGITAVVSAVVLVMKPLVGVTLIDAVTRGSGGSAAFVATGLLPVRISGGSHALDLVSGQVGVLRLPAGSGRVDLSASLHLSPAGWAVYAAVCCIPLVVGALSMRSPTR